MKKQIEILISIMNTLQGSIDNNNVFKHIYNSRKNKNIIELLIIQMEFNKRHKYIYVAK